MAIPFNDKRTPSEKVNALRTTRPYTTGGTKYPKPTTKIKPKKNGLSVTWKF